MTLTAVLMAGGESRRMGRDKALLNIGGRPLWERQLSLLRELQPQTLLVSARARPGWCPPELGVVLDVPPSRGPLSGLAAALTQLRTTHLLALAVDLPWMTTEMLRRLWSAARPGCGVVATSEYGYEGLCAVYPAAAAHTATSALTGGDSSLQQFVRDLLGEQRVTRVTLQHSENTLFRNLNTPAELEALHLPRP